MQYEMALLDLLYRGNIFLYLRILLFFFLSDYVYYVKFIKEGISINKKIVGNLRISAFNVYEISL